MTKTRSKRIPPLAWVIAGLVLVAAAIGFSQWNAGTHTTPTGVVMGSAQTGDDPVMPQQPPPELGPLPPPAPTGAGPTNMPGVQTGPAPNGAPS